MSQVHIDNERLYNVIQRPLISEKATVVAEKNNQVVFKVCPRANKVDIKKAVELMFKVEVHSVQVCNVKGKTKKFAQRLGKRCNWKKAYVTLRKGQEIDFLGTIN